MGARRTPQAQNRLLQIRSEEHEGTESVVRSDRAGSLLMVSLRIFVDGQKHKLSLLRAARGAFVRVFCDGQPARHRLFHHFGLPALASELREPGTKNKGPRGVAFPKPSKLSFRYTRDPSPQSPSAKWRREVPCALRWSHLCFGAGVGSYGLRVCL